MIRCILLLFLAPQLIAQQSEDDFFAEIAKHRDHYRQEFVTEPRSPLTAKDTALLDFFPASKAWIVEAQFVETPDKPVFDMPTYSGKMAQYRQYGVLSFKVDTSMIRMSIYQNVKLLQRPEYIDYLFLPFKDPSNGAETYGGGRYLDFKKSDIGERDGKQLLTIDFNKCYNPYCAYSDGYNCPVPPKENHLKFSVLAGEKNYRGEKKH